jgi:hypothetical protein
MSRLRLQLNQHLLYFWDEAAVGRPPPQFLDCFFCCFVAGAAGGDACRFAIILWPHTTTDPTSIYWPSLLTKNRTNTAVDCKIGVNCNAMARDRLHWSWRIPSLRRHCHHHPRRYRSRDRASNYACIGRNKCDEVSEAACCRRACTWALVCSRALRQDLAISRRQTAMAANPQRLYRLLGSV